MTTEEWNEYFYGHWNFPGEKQNGHIAMFPVELPRRLIKMFSFVGEKVLDPFVGSGTTIVAAEEQQRLGIGVEVNETFRKLIADRFKRHGHSTTRLRFEQPAADTEIDFNRLPYKFVDAVALSRELDPHERDFGSRIGME